MEDLEKISPSVYAHTKGKTRANVTFINLGDALVAVDSGMFPPIAKELREQIEKELGVPTKILVLTHYHGDHVFGNQSFDDCEIIAPKSTYNLMVQRMKTDWSPEKLENYKKERAEFASLLKDLRIVLPTTVFEGYYEISRDNRVVKIYETGGHCEGSSFVYFPEEKVLITGDLYFSGIWPYGGDTTADPYKWIDALEKMISLDVEKIVPGHGPVTSKKELLEFLESMKKLVEVIKSLAKEGVPIEEVAEHEDIPTFGASDDLSKQFKEVTIKQFYEKLSKNI